MTEISWKTKRKGYWMFKQGKVKKVMETSKRIYFKIDGEREHSVIFDKTKKEYMCDCKFWSLKFKPCSHIYACRMFSGEVSEKTEM